MTDKEEINHTALKCVYKLLREKINWALIWFVWLSYWSCRCANVCMCVFAFKSCTCVLTYTCICTVHGLYVYPYMHLRLLTVCMRGWWQVVDFERICEWMKSLNAHVTLAMKSVQFCKMSWESDGSPKSQLSPWWGGRSIEVLITPFSWRGVAARNSTIYHCKLWWNQSQSQQASLQWLYSHCWKSWVCLTNRLIKASDTEPLTVSSVHPFVSVILFSIYCICSFYYQYSIEQYV